MTTLFYSYEQYLLPDNDYDVDVINDQGSSDDTVPMMAVQVDGGGGGDDPKDI